MRMILLLAALASLSACALPGPRPPTEASIAKAADRAVGIETGYALTTEAAALAAHAIDVPTRAKVAAGDRAAFDVLSVGRRTYPPAAALAPADRVRLDLAIERSDAAHADLQAALGPPG